MSAIFKSGNTAVITGGASGIGLALATRCHGYGMKVLVVDQDEQKLADLPKDKYVTLQMDVSKPESWTTLASKVEHDLNGENLD